jgi:replication factor C subunit 3/5
LLCRYPFKPDQIIQNTDWELYIAQIAREIMSEQSPKALFQVRWSLLPRRLG